MNTEQKARFEDAIKAIGYGALKRREDNGCYEYAPTEHAWTGFQAAEAPLLERIAELEGQLANREQFVVKLPLSISVLISDGLHADFMLNSEIKAAITAAGGRCV